MSYGIENIKNGVSEIIIDQEHPPLRVVVTGTVSKTTHANGVDGQYLIPVPTGTTLPMLFIDWPVGTRLINYGADGGYYRIINSQNGGPSSLTYHLCTFTSPASSGGYGIEIYDASGNLTFTSAQKYVRLKELVQLGGPGTTTNHVSHGSSQPVTVPLPLPVRQLVPPGAIAQWYMTSVRRASTTQFETIALGSFLGTTDNVTTPDLPFTFGPSLVILGDF